LTALRRSLLGLAVVALAASACKHDYGFDTTSVNPAAWHAKLSLGGVRIVPDDKNGHQLALDIVNKREHTTVVRILIETPASVGDCEDTQAILPGATLSFSCEQHEIEVDEPYSFEVTAYADAGQTEVVEVHRWQQHFDANGVGGSIAR